MDLVDARDTQGEPSRVDGAGLKVRIVFAPQHSGWIIEKMARRLHQALLENGIESEVAPDPDPRADINHWMSFAFAQGCLGTINTMMITHVDDPYKVAWVRKQLGGPIRMGICMSPHAMTELLELGIPSDRLWYILPAMDGGISPRRIRMGLTTRIYEDGRKREWMLTRLSKEMDLSAFHFDVFGDGWEPVVADLREGGATVDFFPPTSEWDRDYAIMRERIPRFDYYLYLGMDEGSLGALDAVSAGVKTIITPQGFHLDIPGGITHPFTEYEEFKDILSGIAEEWAMASGKLGAWTWGNFAQEHIQIWQALKDPERASDLRAALEAVASIRGSNRLDRPTPGGRISGGGVSYYLRCLQPSRLVGALARTHFLQPVRNLLKRNPTTKVES